MDHFGTEAEIAALEAQWQIAGRDSGSGSDAVSDRAEIAATLAWYLRERDPQRAAGWCDRAEALLAEPSPASDGTRAGQLRARTCLVRSTFAVNANDLPLAAKLAEDAARIFAAAGDVLGLGDAELWSALCAETRADVPGRQSAIEAADDAYRTCGDPVRVWLPTFWTIGDASFRNADDAEQRLATAMATPGLPQHRGIDMCRHRVLALIMTLRGDPVNAAEHFRQAYVAGLESGMTRDAATSASNVAACCINLNDFAGAMEWAERSLDVSRPRRLTRPMAMALYYGAEALRELGRLDEARGMARESRVLLGVPTTRMGRGFAIASLVDGKVSLGLGEPAAALACFLDAETIGRHLGVPDLLADTLVSKARALQHLGRSEEAQKAVEEVLQSGSPQHRPDAMWVQAAIARDLSMPAPAGSTAPTASIHHLQAALEEAAAIASHADSPAWLAELAGDYEACGDVTRALVYERRASAAREALHGKRAADLAAALHVRFETERMIAEAAHLKALAAEQARRAQAEGVRAEAERRRADAEMSANEAKSAFLASMNHELRSPLNALLGMTRLVERDPALPAHLKDDLGVMLRSGRHLQALIDQVLTLSKIEAGRIELEQQAFDLHELLDETLTLHGTAAADRRVSLHFECDPAVPRHVNGDAVRLRQVLINLLSNAIKFTPGDGHVTLRAAATREPGTAPILTLSVTDTGVGIDAQELAHLGEAFVQARAGRESHEGTGLGLAISRGFVQRMGGQLHIDSRPGAGTCVSVSLPVREISAPQDVPGAAPPRVLALAAGQPSPRILVADDRPDGRRVLVRLLRPLGFDVREVADGEQAVAQWREWSPRLILMDMRMPVLDGREATRRIKAMCDGAPPVIIALTASSFDEQREEFLAAGCDDYMRKPIDEDALVEMIVGHLGLACVREGETARASATAPDPQRLARLPHEVRMRLCAALERLDVRTVDDAIEAVRDVDPEAADSLAPLARRFDYERLKALFS